jgi:hypothetical protein
MSQRGVLFIAWEAEDGAERALLDRAIASLRQIHPELPHHVASLPGGSPRLDKAGLLAHSPFETSLFLDSDAVVLGRLDFGFEMVERYGLACCLGDNPWQRRHVDVPGDDVEYDTGVLFFDQRAAPVLEAWARLAPLVDLPVGQVVDRKVVQTACDDRIGFTRAVELCGFVPFVLPLNWNLRPRWQRSFFGPVKLWRSGDPVPEALLASNRYYEGPDAIVQFHELPGAT